MAALGSSVTSTGMALHTSVILHRRHGNPVVSASSHHQRSPNGLATNSSGMNNALRPVKGTTTRILAVAPGNANPSPSGGNLPIPKILPLAKWVFSAAIFAVPMYRRFRTLEDKIERTAEVAIEVIEVAEATEGRRRGCGRVPRQ